MSLSPFTTVLRLYIVNPKADTEGHVKTLLRSIIDDTMILKQDTTYHPFDVLVLSLQDCAHAEVSNSLFEFVDNCILRCSRQPVKYYDDLTALVAAIRSSVGVEVDDCNIDLLLMTILDQWPFLMKSSATMFIESATKWLVRYLDLSMHTGGNITVLSNFRDQFVNQITEQGSQSLLEEALREPEDSGLHHVLREMKKENSTNLVVRLPKSRSDSLENFSIPELPVEGEDFPALRKWVQKETPEAIRDGAVGQLILCLCSKHEEIRKQASAALRSFSGSLEVRFNSTGSEIRLKMVVIRL